MWPKPGRGAIRILTADRPRGLALVVLAACHSGVPGRGYDEAFSLATAFLAGGSRTVVSAQWALPDSATSALMFMVHHHVRAGGLPPADALRAAQLWMLRRGRAVPDTKPRSLRRVVKRGNPADVVAWAGFTHTGRQPGASLTPFPWTSRPMQTLSIRRTAGARILDADRWA